MKSFRIWLIATLAIGLLALSCKPDEPVIPDPDPDPIPQKTPQEQLASMSLREKIGQLFIVRPEALEYSVDWTNTSMTSYQLMSITDSMRETWREYPVGGLIIYAHNIANPYQLTTFTRSIHDLGMLVCIDEEGGSVARIGRNKNFNVKTYSSMGDIGATGDPKNAYECGNTIGRYLKEYGVDINFAPVADVNTNPQNIVIGKRAFSDDPAVAAPMVTNYLQGLKDAGIVGCIKHFPGHGDTTADTHYGYAQSLKTWEQMLACEMITFIEGIKWGAQLIMTAHIAAPNVTGSDVPSTMSPVILQDKLRKELGYKNIIITDSMEMGAITREYTPAESAVGCIKAGADIFLGTMNLKECFDALVSAVQKGDIPQSRIDESVLRVLELKQQVKQL